MSDTSLPQEEQEVKIRECCVCHQPFEPEEETQVLCPHCEELGIRCGCIMSWPSCPICRAVEALEKGKPDLMLDRAWFGYSKEALA